MWCCGWIEAHRTLCAFQWIPDGRFRKSAARSERACVWLRDSTVKLATLEECLMLSSTRVVYSLWIDCSSMFVNLRMHTSIWYGKHAFLSSTSTSTTCSLIVNSLYDLHLLLIPPNYPVMLVAIVRDFNWPPRPLFVCSLESMRGMVQVGHDSTQKTSDAKTTGIGRTVKSIGQFQFLMS